MVDIDKLRKPKTLEEKYKVAINALQATAQTEYNYGNNEIHLITVASKTLKRLDEPLYMKNRGEKMTDCSNCIFPNIYGTCPVGYSKNNAACLTLYRSIESCNKEECKTCRMFKNCKELEFYKKLSE